VSWRFQVSNVALRARRDHRAAGLVEIIPPGARGRGLVGGTRSQPAPRDTSSAAPPRFDGTYPDQDTARRHHASRLGTLSFQHVRDLMVAEARRVHVGARPLAAGS